MVTDSVGQVLKVMGVVCKSCDVICKVKVGRMTVLKPCDALVPSCQPEYTVNCESKQ